MAYTYSGSAPTELIESYAADDPRFRTQESPNFPERDTVIRETQLLRKLLFPSCWNAAEIVDDEAALREMLDELGDQFCRGIEPYVPECLSQPVDAVLDALPAIRQQLKQDVEAAYKGDPAATSYVEVIRAYPGIHAVMIHRVAHVLYTQSQPAYARELAEAAKTATGIDIHPGAELGEYVFIDHGSGVVIGETATIGDWVRLYQEVTLGALHFEEDEDNEQMLKKGYKRHPDIGDNVVIGAGAKILGPISVGDHVSIEANAWVTDDVPAHTNVFIKHPEQTRKPDNQH